ncbi:hypothetical protein TEA_004440 [Camellia sinensis var. sinensis]|uniref:Pectate lyase n=1 Tax=Camellia sinensis var. sinensis TaxID=542762 RepID=A0A4S4CX05_CAMSN|nr:hypothetical protein TEA_004440 [Camellia sinensis var. sinensis]
MYQYPEGKCYPPPPPTMAAPKTSSRASPETQSTIAGGATQTGPTTANDSPTAPSDSATQPSAAKAASSTSSPTLPDPANPTPGTLRYGVIQSEPLWIIFSGNMLIKLKHELIVNSFKTIDGRGANIQITGGGCITLQYISNVIIHNIHVSHCVPSGNTMIRSTPTHVGHRGISDGDGISIFNSHDLWIDHCSLSYCTDGLIDAIMGSTGITISNSYFAHHNEVMLLGHDDKYLPDSGMQVTIAFNHFGVGLVQRMPRCRRGYIHVVNNDFTEWKMYAIGGSANPTINSQGNRYTAPVDPDAKEVTKRVDTNEKDWTDWNWRTDGDIMVNGAFFVPSGQGLTAQYAKASSVEPKSAALITQLTSNSGVFGDPSLGCHPEERLETLAEEDPNSWGDTSVSISYPGVNGVGTSTGGSGSDGGSGSSSGDGGNFFGMIFGSSAPPPPSSSTTTTILLSLSIILSLYITTNYVRHVAGRILQTARHPFPGTFFGRWRSDREPPGSSDPSCSSPMLHR